MLTCRSHLRALRLIPAAARIPAMAWAAVVASGGGRATGAGTQRMRSRSPSRKSATPKPLRTRGRSARGASGQCTRPRPWTTVTVSISARALSSPESAPPTLSGCVWARSRPRRTRSPARRRDQEAQHRHRKGYGNFDIILGLSSRIFQRRCPPPARVACSTKCPCVCRV